MASAVAWALGLGLAAFLFYFLAYRVRRYAVPVGFDAPWYVWRATFVAARGLGPVGTAVRPGSELLGAVAGALLGRSQLEVQVVLPLVLVGVLALAVASFSRVTLGGGRVAWVVTAAVGATVVGATRLVGENVANLLFLALAVAGLALMARRVEGRSGFTGAVVLLAAAGLAHWIFLAVFGAFLALLAVLALPDSLRRHRAGTPLGRTESGVVAEVGAATAAAMGIVIVGVLRAPLETVEIRENPRRFVPKLRTDLGRLFLPLTAPLAAVGAWAVAAPSTSEPPGGRSLGRRVLLAWTVMSAGGMAYGLLTKRLPPHRFLGLWVGLAGAVLMASALLWLAAKAGSRLGIAVIAAGILALGAVGGVAWYDHGPGVWMSPTALAESETAAHYVSKLAANEPVVFLVGPKGAAGVLSVPLKERIIRVALPPDRQASVHFFVGEPADLLAGRRTPVGPKSLAATQGYWDDVRGVLPRHPPVLIVRALAQTQFDAATSDLRATVLAPGVALLQGRLPSSPVRAASTPHPVPPVRFGLLWGAGLLLALFVAGIGWTVALAGPDAPAELLAGLAPACGAAALIGGALIAAKAGIRLGGAGGVATFAVVSVLGIAAAVAAERRS